jgi:choline dehydrogenase-like flavoprotein
VGGNGRAEGVLYFDAAHRLLRQPAKVVVVCANGIGTPRLLLNSTSAAFPDGLANSSGLVGRGCMLHVWRRLRGTVAECVDNYRRPIYNPIFSDHFRAPDPTRGFDAGFALLVRGLNGPLSTASRQNVPWGAEHHRVFGREFPHVVTVSALGEDLPEEHNRVTLDPDARDAYGIPAARVEYSLGTNSRRLLDFAAARARDLLEAMGARAIRDDGPAPGTSHFMGTARMGDDSRTSVVDRWNRSHDIPNLFIVDGSCFVSSGAAGPTATIGALAHRCAYYLVRHRRTWG